MNEESKTVLAYGRDQLNESVSLAVLEDDKVLFIARAEAEHIISTGVRIGAHLPAYCSSTGRVLLGQLTDAELRAALGKSQFPQRTPKTLIMPSLVLREIQAGRNLGYAVSDEEVELGMRSLAVPVRDNGGMIVAALSVSAYSERVGRADLSERFLSVMRACAAQLEKRCHG